MPWPEQALGNIFVRQMGGPDGLSPGHVIQGHTHNFDHTSVFFSGRWRVRRWRPAVGADGVQLTLPAGEPAWVMLDDFERDAPFFLLIAAGDRHAFDYVGAMTPAWMADFLADLTPERRAAFEAEHAKSLGKAWCVYAHRTPQGEVVEQATGWPAAYA